MRWTGNLKINHNSFLFLDYLLRGYNHPRWVLSNLKRWTNFLLRDVIGHFLKKTAPLMSPQSKRGYIEAIFLRHMKASPKEKTLLLSEFCTTFRYHSKHAIRQILPKQFESLNLLLLKDTIEQQLETIL